MSRLVKIVDNKYVQIEEYKNPNICFNTNEYDDFENYCTLRKRFDPFEMFYENQELKKQLEVGEQQYNDLLEEKENLQEQLSIKNLQLEEMKLSKRDYTQENILEMKLTLKENQQKEFISYLENEIDICDGFLDTVKSDLQEIPYGVISAGKTYITTQIKENETTHKVYEEILQKYREIIGGKDER